MIYPEEGRFGKTIGTIMLVIETERDPEWFLLFFGAQRELYRGQFSGGKEVTFGDFANSIHTRRHDSI